MTLPDQLKQHRAQYRLSQEKMAQRIGVSLATYRRWEYGKRKPSVMGWRALAAVGINQEAQGR